MNALWAYSRRLADYGEHAMRNAAAERNERKLAISIALFPLALYPVPYAIATVIAVLVSIATGWGLPAWGFGMAVAHIATLNRIGDNRVLTRYKNELRRISDESRPKRRRGKP